LKKLKKNSPSLLQIIASAIKLTKKSNAKPKKPQNPPPFAGNQRLSPGEPGGQGENFSTEKFYNLSAHRKAVEEKNAIASCKRRWSFKVHFHSRKTNHKRTAVVNSKNLLEWNISLLEAILY
jgi:hypothetical protein